MNTNEGAQCTGKIKHETRADAVAQMVSLKKAFGDTNLEPYICPWCNFWHIGHRVGRKKSKRKGGMYSK